MRRALPYILVLGLLACPATAAARGFTTGFFDGAFTSNNSGPVLDDAVSAGAGMIRLPVGWSSVAKRRPTVAKDPRDPAYDWSGADAAVAAARARGLRVLLSVDGVPRWAQAKRPRRYRRSGAYKPKVRAVRGFARALGRHYAGQVGSVQLLNEPNLDVYLAPQWQHRKPFAPVRYRQLLNAAYPGLHAAGMKLVTAGTAPYGDGGRNATRTRPGAFWRAVLRRRVHFDVLAHHPYAIDGPRRSAYNPDDIAVPDVHRLGTLVRRAVRRGTALPHRHKPVWVTEIGWDSKPPDPDGYRMRTFTRWVGDSMFVLFKQHVDHVFWFLVRDQAPVPSYSVTRQSGIFFASGRPKPALRAFRFPFSCEKRGAGTRVWLRAPSRGQVRIETTSGKVLRRLSPGRDRVAQATVVGRPRVRARSGTSRSITCRA